jgi:hypothetical protein
VSCDGTSMTVYIWQLTIVPRDIHARVALWHPMMQYGWTYPHQDPMTETELADQEQLRKAILEARMFAKDEEIQPNLRIIRLLVGRKDG